MASDISNILKDELANTLEQLLSKGAKVDSVEKAEVKKLEDSQCIEVIAKFDFQAGSTTWKFYIPTQTATKFEYLMLGGMGDLKDHIDDEITDAVNEIVSNICGSICTAVNAQGFADFSGLKSEMQGCSISECTTCSGSYAYDFRVSLDGESLPVLINFDEAILPFIPGICGDDVEAQAAVAPAMQAQTAPALNVMDNNISALLSENSAKNLKLLFDIKLKLSVRLGTKMFLLKDILRWDIGEIIELEQMVNEPLEILVNGIKVGEGEAVIVEGKFGLKIKNIGSESARLSQIGLG